MERQSDPRDGRSALLALTPSGADVLAEWRAARSALLADRLNQLDPADLDRLAAALPVLHGLVDALADARTLAGRLAADPPSAPLKESPGIPGQGPDETRGQGRCRPSRDQMSK